jgi:hypothetical protein
MTPRKLIRFVAVLLSVAALSGCKDQDEAKAALPKVCANFPDAVIYKYDRRVLWIQTHIAGISAKIAETIYQQACQQAAIPIGQAKINIATELNFDGRRVLIVGMRRYAIIWQVAGGVNQATGIPQNYLVMDWPQATEWLTEHLGHAPKAAEIRVVTLKDVQETPKGQPMELQTLAEIQKANRQILEHQLESTPPSE